MILVKLQRLLERIYEIERSHEVADFLITDASLAQRLDSSGPAREVREKLLVAESADGLDVALYVDPRVLEQLDADDPTENLHDGNLASFWIALEGVSHFLYVTRSVAHDRSVSLLELELQAEVDKYIASLFLLSRPVGAGVPVRLHAWLFEQPSFDASLDGEGLERYRQANRYAGRYCRHLNSRFLGPRRASGLMSELRRFYRLPQHRKMRHIDTSTCAFA
ncbi:MAG: hypothetical protein H0W33_00640 [Gammaproteobacteria bacterium]|nr:hypothetical protein [Gammaproteobacteria bacterium]